MSDFLSDKLLWSALLCPAVYADGTTEYNAHNLFGTAMTMRTHAAAVEVMGRRPFVMVRWVACCCW
jgi:hypothetical protein